MREVKMRKRNLSMTWIAYKKAYDMMPHSWIGINEETFGRKYEIMASIIDKWRGRSGRGQHETRNFSR